MKKISNLEGLTFGDWYVLASAGIGKDRHMTWLCRCVCGTVRPVSGGNLSFGGSLGCGCTKCGLRLRPYEALYNTLVKMNSDKEVNLTYEEFVEFTSTSACHYCDDKIYWSEYNIAQNGSNYNLDRKDNVLGYYKENCVVCCPRCNRAKSNHFTYKEFVQIGALIKSWRT